MSTNIEDIISKQRQLTKELEEYQKTDLFKENRRLEEKLKVLEEKLATQQSELKEKTSDSKQLKEAFYTMILRERTEILAFSRKKVDMYLFKSHGDEEKNLQHFENKIKQRIELLRQNAKNFEVAETNEIYSKITELETLLVQKIATIKKEKDSLLEENNKIIDRQYDDFASQEITEETIKKRAKTNNIERFIGLNLLNKVGILLIIIATFLLTRSAFVEMTDTLRSVLIFILGGVMLGVGEFLNRKHPNVFSLGVTSGGVAVLYISVFVSYFVFGILDMLVALILCILITLSAFLLSVRYNAQVVLSFSLIGGYLPIIASILNPEMIYAIMIYLIILNTLALLISFRHKWSIATLIGMILNILSTIYIVQSFKSGFNSEAVFVLIYILFVFGVYTLIPIMGTIKSNSQLKRIDVVVVSINTIMSSLIMFNAFYKFDLNMILGVSALVFASIYLYLGNFISEKIKTSENMSAVFYLTGFTFTVLVIPFQFGAKWAVMGAIIEGTSLAVFGILKGDKLTKRAGLTLFLLSLPIFIFVNIFLDNTEFLYDYSTFTLGSIAILSAFVYSKNFLAKHAILFKNFTIINLELFLIYFSNEIFYDVIRKLADTRIVYFLYDAVVFLPLLMLPFIVMRIKPLLTKSTKFIVYFMYIMNILSAFNLVSKPVFIENQPTEHLIFTIIGTVVVIFATLMATFELYELVSRLSKEKNFSFEVVFIAVSIYILLMLTNILTSQFGLHFQSFIISIIYMISALIWVVFGFIKRFGVMRRIGLALAILSVVKLFLIDFNGMAEGNNIITYFVLGTILLGISFIYQYFSKRLEMTVNVKESD